jgi:hypothetical protein
VGEVFFDFDEEIGVSESNAVAFGGAVEIGVGAARNLEGHLGSLFGSLFKSLRESLLRIGLRIGRAARLESFCTRAFERSLLHFGTSEFASDQTIAAVNHAVASELGELHFLFFARLEANRGAGRIVETHAEGRGAIERERAIGLKEMVVAANLNGPIAGIFDEEAARDAAGVREDWSGTFIKKIFTGLHGVTGLDRES